MRSKEVLMRSLPLRIRSVMKRRKPITTPMPRRKNLLRDFLNHSKLQSYHLKINSLDGYFVPILKTISIKDDLNIQVGRFSGVSRSSFNYFSFGLGCCVCTGDMG
ncbi:965af5ad-fdaf-4076-9450-cd581e6aacfa [Sclerotinia trifoliorum]|uniref:965af5ad-fdaf-4076-9450-cd581e6aacfa n=1 Tax=Sclerotinia trifoliorum TaxID=28548 RepID=A0A8H2VZZ1_9HELO|nr:965af5ad-fdaf-4076-9450-cd581e6aacfa [Sclerotinia trifoliorum]